MSTTNLPWKRNRLAHRLGDSREDLRRSENEHSRPEEDKKAGRETSSTTSLAFLHENHGATTVSCRDRFELIIFVCVVG